MARPATAPTRETPKFPPEEVIPFEPLEDLLIVRRKKTKTTAGGIVLPETDPKGSKFRSFVVRGEILAAGPGKTKEDGSLIPMVVKPGDLVFYSSQAGLELEEEWRQVFKEFNLPIQDAQDIILLRQTDIVCKMKDPNRG